MDAIKGKTSEAMEATKRTTGMAEDKAPPADTSSVGQKAGEMAQYAQDRACDAAQWTKDSAVAGKDTAGSVLQQAGGQVMGAAVGAKDAVMNTLGMGEDKPAAPVAGKDDTAGGFLQQAGGQVMGAKDAGMKALGVGEEKSAAPVAGKDDTTGNFLQQAGGQVMGAAVGAKDAVVNTLGMGGDKADVTKDH